MPKTQTSRTAKERREQLLAGYNLPRVGLITHSGNFHLDDVLASVILLTIYPQATITRSRDPAIVASPSDGNIIFDVGGAYDPDSRRFDHHQPGAAVREDGRRYSAVGLIWKHYGETYLEAFGLEPEIADAVWKRLDDGLIRAIDLNDNGQAPQADGLEAVMRSTSLSTLIEGLNPRPDAPEADFRAGFDMAIRIIHPLIDAQVRKLAFEVECAARVKAAIRAQWGNPVLELNAPMPFEEAVFATGAAHILFVTQPMRDGWSMTAMNTAPASFTPRALMPEGWAGLREGELDLATGIPGGVFAHVGRWYAIHKDQAGINAMAGQALAELGIVAGEVTDPFDQPDPRIAVALQPD